MQASKEAGADASTSQSPSILHRTDGADAGQSPQSLLYEEVIAGIASKNLARKEIAKYSKKIDHLMRDIKLWFSSETIAKLARLTDLQQPVVQLMTAFDTRTLIISRERAAVINARLAQGLDRDAAAAAAAARAMEPLSGQLRFLRKVYATVFREVSMLQMLQVYIYIYIYIYQREREREGRLPGG
mmetsp:Transcript_76625/g.206448  ORF Transcript_76625/g.206448 Transcript_76625/m.206448 type:complete len:186 (-) Transcript_76625:257-814(-)